MERLDAEAAATCERLRRWDLDAWELSDDECIRLLVGMFHTQGLLRQFPLAPTRLTGFLEAVRKRYHDGNPFHNFRRVRQRGMLGMALGSEKRHRCTQKRERPALGAAGTHSP